MVEERDLVELTAEIVSSYVSNNNVHVGDVPTVIASVHAALSGLGAAEKSAPEPDRPKAEPAVSIRSSVKPDAITCLFCGKKQRTLKRHLATAHNTTPAEYRETFGLKPDYPMVAPAYSDQRREMAVSLGLGRKGEGGRKGAEAVAEPAAEAEADAAPAPKPAARRGRKKADA